jgi:hypothetical protein
VVQAVPPSEGRTPFSDATNSLPSMSLPANGSTVQHASVTIPVSSESPPTSVVYSSHSHIPTISEVVGPHIPSQSKDEPSSRKRPNLLGSS